MTDLLTEMSKIKAEHLEAPDRLTIMLTRISAARAKGDHEEARRVASEGIKALDAEAIEAGMSWFDRLMLRTSLRGLIWSNSRRHELDKLRQDLDGRRQALDEWRKRIEDDH
jgi:hypothetical protein